VKSAWFAFNEETRAHAETRNLGELVKNSRRYPLAFVAFMSPV